jgi:threonine synthase
MRFKSTRGTAPEVSFKDAALRCLPPAGPGGIPGGLYVPSTVPDMRQFFLHMDEKTSYPELVATLASSLLQGEFNPFSAARVAESAFNFEPELIRLDNHFSLLSLYNGPTGTFKDFGVAFLAAVLEELLKNTSSAMIISAARGDTGISMARAFQGRKGLTTVLLYPRGTIYGIESSSLASRGGNIIPIQVKGTYDDCQALVTGIINDRPFAERYNVTSANTINPIRLLPQAFYYLYAFIRAKKHLLGDLFFSVPSGNFGNLIAGLYAWKFGMPVNGFIAAMNANNAFGEFIRGGAFTPHSLVPTNSPALDITQPSNYERLASFYKESPAVMRSMVFPAAISNDETVAAIKQAWNEYHVLLDPHSAVAFAAAGKFPRSKDGSDTHTVILATGHPAKEAELVKAASGQTAALPEKLLVMRKRSEPIALIDPHLDALEGAIASCL